MRKAFTALALAAALATSGCGLGKPKTPDEFLDFFFDDGFADGLEAREVNYGVDFPLTARGRDYALDVYSNGLGEFYARNNLSQFGKIEIDAARDLRKGRPSPLLRDRALLPIGGGKDSLVSMQLLDAAGPISILFCMLDPTATQETASKRDRIGDV